MTFSSCRFACCWGSVRLGIFLLGHNSIDYPLAKQQMSATTPPFPSLEWCLERVISPVVEETFRTTPVFAELHH